MTGRVSIADILRSGYEATRKNLNSVVPLFVGLQAAVFLLTYLLNMPFLNILMVPVVLLMSFDLPWLRSAMTRPAMPVDIFLIQFLREAAFSIVVIL